MAVPRPHPIRWLREHPAAADMLLAVFLTVISVTFHLLDLETDGEEYTDPSWWTVPLVVLSVFPIAWRRRYPIGSAAVVVTAQVISAWADIDGTGFVGVIVAMYSVGAHTSGPRRTKAVVAMAAALAILFLVGLAVGELKVGAFVTSTILLVTSFVVGDNLRRRREAAAALAERAERAERERELIAQQQVHAERSRIARELHDVVAHSVSVMVIQASAARRSLASSPQNAEQALTNIEETGRQTMNELRGILGVLRRNDPAAAGDSPLGPQPTLADVRALVDVADDLPIELVVDGVLTDLPNSVTLTGYRVIQEALTNVRRHAGPVGNVVVSVRRRPDSISIVVEDDGRGAAADDSGPGYGIVGMTERVTAIGGTVEARPRSGGGWRVAAFLPASAAGPSELERSETPDPERQRVDEHRSESRGTATGAIDAADPEVVGS